MLPFVTKAFHFMNKFFTLFAQNYKKAEKNANCQIEFDTKAVRTAFVFEILRFLSMHIIKTPPTNQLTNWAVVMPSAAKTLEGGVSRASNRSRLVACSCLWALSRVKDVDKASRG